MVNGIVIDEAIIDEVNDMLKDGKLVLDENGCIIDYRDIEVELISAEVSYHYGSDNQIVSIHKSVEFYVGEARYQAVCWVPEKNCKARIWIKEGCKATLYPWNAYLLVYDAENDAWLVCGSMSLSEAPTFRAHAQKLVEDYISPILRLPYFEL